MANIPFKDAELNRGKSKNLLLLHIIHIKTDELEHFEELLGYISNTWWNTEH